MHYNFGVIFEVTFQETENAFSLTKSNTEITNIKFYFCKKMFRRSLVVHHSGGLSCLRTFDNGNQYSHYEV